MGRFYKEFGLKKVLECGGAESWKKVQVGNKVQLILDFEKYNLTDLKKQVGVVWKDNIVLTKEYEKSMSKTINRSNDGTVIGVISEEEGKLIKDFLDMGWDSDILFSAIISQNDDTKPLENRFKVAVYINEKKSN